MAYAAGDPSVPYNLRRAGWCVCGSCAIDQWKCASIKNYLVYVAPTPVFAGLKRLDDRMMSPVEMLGCVPVLRAVATSDVAAGQAKSQVNPIIPKL